MDGNTPVKGNKAQKAVQGVIYFIIVLYPLILFRADLGGIQIQSLLLLVAAMGALLYSFLLIHKNEWEFRRQYQRVDLAFMALMGYEFFRVIWKMLFADGESSISYDWEVLIISLSVVYLICSVNVVFDKTYFDALIFSGLIVFGCLLFHFLCGSGMDAILAVMAQDKYATASYILLVCIISLYQYCRCRDKMRSCFYVGTSVVGYLVLFLNHSVLSIWLMALVFIGLPMWIRPTAELIKRDMQLFFLYAFLLSNMSLLTEYTGLVRTEVSFSLEQSVYLDLMLAAGGIWFFNSWDKIPEGVDPERLVLRKMKRGYQFLLKTLTIIFAGFLIGGVHWKSLPDGMAMSALKGFAVPLVEEVQGTKSFFYMVIEEQGVTGGILILILCSLATARLKRNYSYDKPDTGIMVLLSTLFLLQMLFWKMSINTLPIYFVFLAFAILYKEERERVSSTKIKFEREEN